MDKKDFYDQCADLLGTTHAYNTINDVIHRTDRRTGQLLQTNCCRWYGREPGNGLFPRFGTIRSYGRIVHVALHHPIKVNRQFPSMEATLEYLREALPPAGAR